MVPLRPSVIAAKFAELPATDFSTMNTRSVPGAPISEKGAPRKGINTPFKR